MLIGFSCMGHFMEEIWVNTLVQLTQYFLQHCRLSQRLLRGESTRAKGGMRILFIESGACWYKAYFARLQSPAEGLQGPRTSRT